VTLTDPAGGTVLSKALETQGKFAFTSAVGGEHLLCFATNSSRWFGQPKKFVSVVRQSAGGGGGRVALRTHTHDAPLVSLATILSSPLPAEV
jgi:hypothetical protein